MEWVSDLLWIYGFILAVVTVLHIASMGFFLWAVQRDVGHIVNAYLAQQDLRKASRVILARQQATGGE
jgi:hypothetical protein